MKCEKCGYLNPDDAKFCGNCKKKLGKPAEKSALSVILKIVTFILAALGAIFVILVLLVMFSGPSAADVEAEIDAIGTVSVHSEAQIQNVAQMYAELSKKEQAKVKNADVLVKASAEYARQTELIANALEAVGKLETITLDSEDAILAARKKYDQAKQYDLDGTMDEAAAVLEAAEAELANLVEAQQHSLDYVLKDVGDVTSLFCNGYYRLAQEHFLEQLERLLSDKDMQQYADVVIKRICEQAQTSYDKKNYVEAISILQSSEVVQAFCSSNAASDAQKLEQSFAQKLNSSAPENGKVLARTFSKGSNSFTITAGDMDTVVKIESVKNPDEYATIYIRANKKATLYNIKTTEFRVKYTTGPVWFGKTKMFGPNATYIMLKETINPKSSTSSSSKSWTQFTWKITSGYGDEYGYQNIDPKDF